MNLRRATVATALAVLGATAWWVVRAPAVERQPASTAPDIDVDPPALRARREAALALATMPDDPWTFAESLAASAPASAADRAADRTRCGIDERPQFRDPQLLGDTPPTDQTAAAGPHYLAARARMDAALRASADPFDRAVADWLDVGQMRTPSGRVDALVQQALATSNAKVYALALRTCLAGSAAAASCAGLNARHWADLDPGNGVPWLYAFNAARISRDPVGQQEALVQLAAASRYDDYPFAPAASVVAHASPDERDLAAVSDLSTEAIGRNAGAPAPVAPLIAACAGGAGGDAARAEQCQSISDAMFDRTDDIRLRTLAGVLQLRTTGDDSRRDVVRAERALLSRSWSPATGFSPCQQERDTLKGVLRNDQVGEVEAARERARTFITP